MISDAELTAIALAADPDPPVPADAVALSEVLGAEDEPLVSAWYMPSPAASLRGITGWRRNVIVFLVVVFLLIEVYGLCSAYGTVVIG